MPGKRYVQGRFHPQNPEKYIGDITNIIYRSSWELKFMKWCDRNVNVLQYGSEEFFIPYQSPVDRRIHRYFPDFIIKVRESNGDKKTYIIEVKPKRETVPPVPGKKQRKTLIRESTTYAINQAKWKAAREWCADRLIEFKIITEDELF